MINDKLEYGELLQSVNNEYEIHKYLAYAYASALCDFIVYAIGSHGYIQVQETKYVEGSVVVLNHRKFYQHLESYY